MTTLVANQILYRIIQNNKQITVKNDNIVTIKEGGWAYFQDFTQI